MKQFDFLTGLELLKMDFFERKAEITWFAKVLGGEYKYDGFLTHFSDSKHTLEKEIGSYWTRTCNSIMYTAACCEGEDRGFKSFQSKNIGSRPVLRLYDNKIPTNGQKIRKNKYNYQITQYGFYPQTIVGDDYTRVCLEKLYKKGELLKTNNSYTILHYGKNSLKTFKKKNGEIDVIYTNYSPYKFQEYEYDGERYIRTKVDWITGNVFQESEKSTNEDDIFCDVTWIKVEPIEWIVYKKQKYMITKNVIFAGVPFNENNEEIDFKDTTIKKFMDTYFARDIEQIREEIKQKEYEKRQAQFEVEKDIINKDMKKLYESNPSYDSYIDKISNIFNKVSLSKLKAHDNAGEHER